MSQIEELRRLLDAVCEDRFAPADIARIEELVFASPEAEAYYIQYMGMYAELATTFSASAALRERSLGAQFGASEISAESPILRTPPARRGRRRTVAILAGCLMILASVCLSWFAPWRPAVWKPDQVIVLDEPFDDTVAVLRAESGANWGSPSRTLQVGSTLPPGRLKLTEGIAEIEFYSGATVVLQAPVEFEILSSMEAYCWNGKLRATVPPHAQGFTIGSPGLDLIDRGTEFGMEVKGLDSTEVHVFDGKVELYRAGAAGKSSPERELTAGQAIRSDQPEAAAPTASDPNAFISSAELQARTLAEARRQKRVWESSSDARRRDPSVVVYYTFETEDDRTRVLENQSMTKLPGSDGTVVGCQWAEGRWPGKTALDFRQVSDRVRLTIPGDFEAVTMAMWARIDSLPNKFHSLLMSDSGDEFEGHWHINSEGTIELGVQGPERKAWTHYHAHEQFRPEMLGQWVHLAVVYDRAGKRVTQFLNGAVISTLPIELDVPLRFGDCELGNWNPTMRKHHHPIRFLTGRIDEFVLYSRALTDREIADFASEGQQ